jgi:hypothetical protein
LAIKQFKTLDDNKTVALTQANMRKISTLIAAVIFTAAFTLPQPAAANGGYIVLSSYSGKAGSSISINGGGFQPSEVVSIYIGASTVPATSLSSSSSGLLGPVSVVIPIGTPPETSVSIKAMGTSGLSAAASFYVQGYYPAISVSSSGNTPFSTVYISGSGFAPNEAVAITMGNFVNTETTANSQGEFATVNFKIPSVEAGSYTIDAVGSLSKGKATSYFYVGGFYPNIFPSAFYLLPGQKLSFSGGGFAPNETVSVIAASKQVSEFETDSVGAYKDAGTFTIPVNTSSGPMPIVLKGISSGSQVSAEISVGKFNPQVFPSSYFLRPGDIISFSGIDFAPHEVVKVYDSENPSSLNAVFADAKGSFPVNSLGFRIPAEFASTKRTIKIVGEASQTPLILSIAIGKFIPQLAPSSYYIKGGEPISVDGWDFMPEETVDVKLLGSPAGTLTANKTGNIKFGPVTVPFQVKDFELSVYGQSSGGSANLSIPISQYFPTVNASSYYLKPGEAIGFWGGAFAPNEPVEVSMNSTAAAPVLLGTIGTNKDGYLLDNTYNVDFSVPAGQVIYTFKGMNSNAVSELTVEVAPFNPLISSDNYYPVPGSTIKIWAEGFGSSEVLNIYLNGKEVTSVGADPYGSAGPISIKLPVKGTQATIKVSGISSKASKELELSMATFSPVVSPSAYYTLPGNPISFNGWGFAPNENISISTGSKVIGSASADAKGNFASGQFVIPFDASSAISYTFTGENSEQPYTVDISLGRYNPYILLSVYYGSSGTIQVISGHDFAPNEKVNVNFGSLFSNWAIAGSRGTFTLDMIIPSGSGTVQVEASGELSRSRALTNFIYAQ